MSDETSAPAETRGGRSATKGLPLDVERRLRSEHGEIVVVRTPHGTFAFKTPTLEDYERFIDRVSEAKGRKGPASRELCNLSLIYPADLTVLDALFERRPALSIEIANELATLARGDCEIEIKKG